MNYTADILVIGGGLVGSTIAFGLCKRGCRVLVVDGADNAQRASRANAGLIWVQGKGAGLPAYHALTRQSVLGWPSFAEEVEGISNTNLDYRSCGGLHLCLGDAEYEARAKLLADLSHSNASNGDTFMLDRTALQSLLPRLTLGKDVAGASFCSLDGQINSLRLVSALHVAMRRLGAALIHNTLIERVSRERGGSFTAVADGAVKITAAKVVLANGLSSVPLALQLGFHPLFRSERGQLLVTERLEPFLPLPISSIHQTEEGTVLLGSTHERDSADVDVTSEGARAIASRAIRMLPRLSDIIVVRQWAGLRLITPDGGPVYGESAEYPGAFIALTHSAVTLTPIHATHFADGVVTGGLGLQLAQFEPGRFNV